MTQMHCDDRLTVDFVWLVKPLEQAILFVFPGVATGCVIMGRIQVRVRFSFINFLKDTLTFAEFWGMLTPP